MATKDKLSPKVEGVSAACDFCDAEAEKLARSLLDIAVVTRNRLVREGYHPMTVNCSVRHAIAVATGHILGYSIHSEDRDPDAAGVLFKQIGDEINVVASTVVFEARKTNQPQMDLSTYTGPMGSC